GQFLEFELAFEDDAGAAIGEPAHFTFDRPQAFDDDDYALADAIFLDRFNLHSAQRNIVDIDGVIDFSDPDRRLALDIQARRTGPKAVAWFAPGEEFAQIDILVEFQADSALADPDHGGRDLLGR